MTGQSFFGLTWLAYVQTDEQHLTSSHHEESR